MSSMLKKDFAKIRFYFFIFVLVLITTLFFKLIQPYIFPLIFAGIFAGMFHPLYKKLKNYISSSTLSSIITVLVFVFIILIPLIFVTSVIFSESVDLYVTIESEVEKVTTEQTQLQNKYIQNQQLLDYLESTDFNWKQKFTEVTQSITQYFFTGLRKFTESTLRIIVSIFITIYTMYYFLKDGDKLLQKLLHIIPLGEKYEKGLYLKFTSTAKATLKGTLVIGLIQGTVAALILWITGVKAAAFWGLIMVILSIIPAVGPALIMLPAGIIQLVLGNIWQGLIILIAGVIFVSIIDNLLRPPLVGKDIQMHPLLIFFSTVGGLTLFGMAGFVIGPIIASLFVALWDIYELEFRKELKIN